jgi:hypothetical protein
LLLPLPLLIRCVTLLFWICCCCCCCYVVHLYVALLPVVDC